MHEQQTRTKKLVETRLQVKLTSYFACLVLAALLFQFVLFASAMAGSAAQLSEVSSTLYEEFRSSLFRSLAYSIAVVLPLTMGVGVLVTFRIAGPVYRFSQFLKSIAAGERPADCVLRKGDELQELCTLLNRATAPQRLPAAKSGAGESQAAA